MSWRALALSLLLAACSSEAPELPSFEHYPALAQGLARAEADVAAETAPDSGDAAALEEEHVSGLVHMLANSRGRMRELPLEEISALGDAAVPDLVVIAANSEHDSGERLAACELLAKLATPLACEHLCQLVERSPESWMRAQAAWRLGTTDSDWLVPRLLLRLKYETDPETVVWLASTLGAYRNYDGLAVLWRFRNDQGSSEELRASAQERLDSLARDAGLDSPEQHWELWNVADPDRRLLNTSPSPRLRLEMWKWISQLSGEHFQLRGVDDARFVLSRMGSWVVAPLCEALHDEDVYVQVHAAQCLERMGPRATEAGPALVQALADPGLAAQAAAALGRIAYPSAEPILRARLTDRATAHELRVACAAALGELGLGASVRPLESILTDTAQPYDLRQVAANALVRLAAGDRASEFLIAALGDPDADQPGAEEQLERWLRSREDEAGSDLLEAWDALAPPPGIIPTTEQARARREARRELLERPR